MNNRDIERNCIDDKGHRIIYHDFFKQCEKCGCTWFYTNSNNPTKVDDEKPAQSSHLTHRPKYRD